MALVPDPNEQMWAAVCADYHQETITVHDSGNKHLKRASKKAGTALYGRFRMGFDLSPRKPEKQDDAG